MIIEILQQFIQDKDQKTLLINGKWGVGKTYVVNQFISKNLSTSNYKGKYSYVSLFGANATTSFDLGQLIEDVNKQGIDTKDLLICFDDIERKSVELRMSQILGLISVLTEYKNCKVIIISNIDELYKNEDDKEELNRYREKVVDIEVSYNPSIQDNYNLIFDDDLYLPIFEKLGLNNLRIMKKVKNNVVHFEDILQCTLSKINPNLVSDFYIQIAIYTIFRYEYTAEVDIEKVVKETPRYMSFITGKEKTSRYELFQKINFSLQDYDEHIVFYIINGYFDKSKLCFVLEDCNKRLYLSGIRKELADIWGKYNSNFLCSATDFITCATSFLNSYALEIDFKELLNLVQLIEELNEKPFPTRYIDQYIEKKVLCSKDLNIETLLFFEKYTTDRSLLDELALRKNVHRENRTVSEVVAKLTGKAGWDPKDYILLSQKGNDEIMEWLKSDEENIIWKARTLLARCSPDSPEYEYEKQVKQNVISCLEIIKNENKINKLRIEQYILLKDDISPT